MTDDYYDRLMGIIRKAELINDPSEKAAFLAQQCNSDPTTLEHAERLLPAAIPLLTYSALEDAMRTPTDHLGCSDNEPPYPKIDGFRIQEVIGRGGSGIVYLAYEEAAERPVAIKVVANMPSEIQAEFIRQEVRTLGVTGSANIVHLFHTGETLDCPPRLYIAMEYVKGQILDKVILSEYAYP